MFCMSLSESFSSFILDVRNVIVSFEIALLALPPKHLHMVKGEEVPCVVFHFDEVNAVNSVQQ